MRWAKKQDPESSKKIDDHTTLIYNSSITISGIPEEAESYQLGAVLLLPGSLTATR